MKNKDLETIAVENGKRVFYALRECIWEVQRLETGSCDGYPEDVKSMANGFDPDMYDTVMWLTDSYVPEDYFEAMADKNHAACVSARRLIENPDKVEEVRDLFHGFRGFASEAALYIGQKTDDEGVDDKGLHSHWTSALNLMQKAAIGVDALDDYEDVAEHVKTEYGVGGVEFNEGP